LLIARGTLTIMQRVGAPGQSNYGAEPDKHGGCPLVPGSAGSR
jgi:hypothetical protein